MVKAIVALSGGLDSTCLLSKLLKEGTVSRKVELAVGFYYGSRHNTKENLAASRIASHYNIPFRLFNLYGIMSDFGSAIMKGSEKDVPHGHYAEESMRDTVIPGRNLIFLAVLAGIAEDQKCQEIYIGAHAGDHFIYPDCRPEFLKAASEAVFLSSGHKVSIRAPFVDMDKAGVLRVGLSNNAPVHLSWTCYEGKDIACGQCGSCQERLEAFSKCGIEDPIAYAHRVILPKTS